MPGMHSHGVLPDFWCDFCMRAACCGGFDRHSPSARGRTVLLLWMESVYVFVCTVRVVCGRVDCTAVMLRMYHKGEEPKAEDWSQGPGALRMFSNVQRTVSSFHQ